jgi:hypothetical protein
MADRSFPSSNGHIVPYRSRNAPSVACGAAKVGELSSI